jgi:hypothetical protein
VAGRGWTRSILRASRACDTWAPGPSTSPLDAGTQVKLRQAINSAAGLALLGGLAYCSYSYLTAESRVKRICAAIPSGSTLQSLTEFASSHGLNAPSGRSDIVIMAETRTFGRYGCKAHMKNGMVTLVEYDHAD